MNADIKVLGENFKPAPSHIMPICGAIKQSREISYVTRARGANIKYVCHR